MNSTTKTPVKKMNRWELICLLNGHPLWEGNAENLSKTELVEAVENCYWLNKDGTIDRPMGEDDINY